MADDQANRTIAVAELPVDELITYGKELGLPLDAGMGHGELLRRVRERQELLVQLDRDALLDVVVWARRPVRQSASKEQLAKEIAGIKKMDFKGLSDRGLRALALLRGISPNTGEHREMTEARLKAAEGLWDKLTRKRRQVLGSVLNKVVGGSTGQDQDAYRFLPEDGRSSSLKEEIAEQGVVGSITRRLRGVADDYVREKLDEIEARIDRKLDEIDARLGEWRDREIANRLKIIKITLVASVLVALLSYGYSYLKVRMNQPEAVSPAHVSEAAR